MKNCLKKITLTIKETPEIAHDILLVFKKIMQGESIKCTFCWQLKLVKIQNKKYMWN